ncbi:MAG TPA: 1,2-phenylacetyl-CoA epoxidase subunit PaaC [Caldimonas sp.]|jgi:ring-1,2-phenylacetyl-CoA epoxidase subunit PaaC|nr:1,2-phenylacetyl-CoA epoxidase subunit PaaC [Caldimonas sp.]HEX2541693.1 1,2-phenylacetyl-CoA epoxidase subunit PaaC [Caldimonas sp.]
MPAASITVSADPGVQYLLRIGDTCLILAQRLGEWCGHAPIVEEDIALTNMALDLVGQARAVLTRAGQLEAERGGERHDEDQLAFLREERDFRNCTLVELPRGDFAVTVVRNCAVAVFLELLWGRLERSTDSELAAIAGKAVKEARYHREHAADWVVRLGDGTPESTARMKAALDHLWPYMAELFEADAIDEAAAASGLGPRWADLREPWNERMAAVLAEAGLAAPAERAFRSTGKSGRHSEHLGYILAEMQHLQRAFPGGVW